MWHDLIYGVRKSGNYKSREWNGGFLWLRKEGNGEKLAKGQ
jgi:hypothetical protein